MNYTVQLKSTQYTIETRKAETPHEAVEKILQSINGGDSWSPILVYDDDGNEWEPIARCEGCGKVIMDSDNYTAERDEVIYSCESCSHGPV